MQAAVLVLVDPLVLGGLVLGQLLGLEPEGDLLVGGLDAVAAVDDVAASLDAEVAANAAGLRVGGVGLAEHHTAGLDHTQALPDHGHDGAHLHVVDEAGEERAAGQVGVVLLQQLLARLLELEGDQLEALHLEALDDLADQSTLDTVGLHHDEGSFLVSGGHCSVGSVWWLGVLKRSVGGEADGGEETGESEWKHVAGKAAAAAAREVGRRLNNADHRLKVAD